MIKILHKYNRTNYFCHTKVRLGVAYFQNKNESALKQALVNQHNLLHSLPPTYIKKIARAYPD